jgi:hypothetical protein
MHASPGCISGDSEFPPVHVVPLVHVGAVSNGPLPPAQSPGGRPALTHACIAAISVEVAGAAGAGGIGFAVFVILASARAATVVPPIDECAMRSSYVTSGIGTPSRGGFE